MERHVVDACLRADHQNRFNGVIRHAAAVGADADFKRLTATGLLGDEMLPKLLAVNGRHAEKNVVFARDVDRDFSRAGFGRFRHPRGFRRRQINRNERFLLYKIARHQKENDQQEHHVDHRRHVE